MQAPDWAYDEPDYDEDEEDDDSECGGWINGRFSYYGCTMAGTEYCDWECPNGGSSRLRKRSQDTTNAG